MHFTRRPLLSRMLVLLALFQLFAPSVAAIADAWRMDQREAYVHVESESSKSCVVVHAHDCVLCSVATGPTGAVPPSAVPDHSCAARTQVTKGDVRAHHATRTRASSPRAPPTLEG